MERDSTKSTGSSSSSSVPDRIWAPPADLIRCVRSINRNFLSAATKEYEEKFGVKITGGEQIEDLKESVLKDMKIVDSLLEQENAKSGQLVCTTVPSTVRAAPVASIKGGRSKCRHNISPNAMMSGNPSSRQGPCTLCGLEVKECPICNRAFLYGNASQRNHFHGQHMQNQHGIGNGGNGRQKEKIATSTAAAGLLSLLRYFSFFLISSFFVNLLFSNFEKLSKTSALIVTAPRPQQHTLQTKIMR